MVDAVDQTNPNLGVVVGHEDDVEELLTVGVELPELSIHCFQSLQHPGDREWESARTPRNGPEPPPSQQNTPGHQIHRCGQPQV